MRFLGLEMSQTPNLVNSLVEATRRRLEQAIDRQVLLILELKEQVRQRLLNEFLAELMRPRASEYRWPTKLYRYEFTVDKELFESVL